MVSKKLGRLNINKTTIAPSTRRLRRCWRRTSPKFSFLLTLFVSIVGVIQLLLWVKDLVGSLIVTDTALLYQLQTAAQDQTRLKAFEDPAYRRKNVVEEYWPALADNNNDLHPDNRRFQPSQEEMDYKRRFSTVFPYYRNLGKIHQYTLEGDSKVVKVDREHLEIESVNNNAVTTTSVAPSSGIIQVLVAATFRIDPEQRHQKFEKYFQEAHHIDTRFSKPNIYTQQFIHDTLVQLLRAWSRFTVQYDIQEWWIAHGNLLSWFWNRKLFSYETDLDIQISLLGLKQLWSLNYTKHDDHHRYLLD